MEMFNKIYSQVSSSVSSTVSQLSGVLPGNPVTREFDASSHIASAGPGLLWKVYKGYKRSTRQETAIFVFEKRQLDKWNKTDREIILESLRKGVTQITKIRHPRVLTIQHPLEESRESLAFATEPVFSSLANILGHTYNMPQPSNMSNYKLFDVEIKYGLLQISEGLKFLHNDVKLLHGNIAPENIMINHQGVWKIFGFDFCVHNTSPPNASPFYPFQELSPTVPSVAQCNLDFCSPEIVLMNSHSPASDIFALGMLIYALFSPDHQPLFPVRDMLQIKNRAQQLKQIPSKKLECLPEALKDYVKLMFSTTPEMRPDAHQLSKIPYFNDIGVKTLAQLDSLLQWDNLQKSQFYRGLPEALAKLPQRVKVQQVLPCLVRDLAQPMMIPFVLPSILDISQECNQKEFVSQILPHLKPVMKLTSPVQILLIFLQRMELLLKLTPAEDIQQHVLPMLHRGLDGDNTQIHQMCLSILPTFAGLLDHANVKNSVLPRIKRLCLSTSSTPVRVSCLLCIGQLLEHLDKWLVLDEIIPFLPQIPSREPAVLMGILGILKLALNHKKLGISKEIIATRILPFLIPLSIENGLTLAQFNALVALIKQMLQVVETEHRTKLEQLNSVEEQQKVLENQLPAIASSISKPVALDDAFEGLGLDNTMDSSFTLEDKQLLSNQGSLTLEDKQLFSNQGSLTLEDKQLLSNQGSLTLEDKQQLSKQDESVKLLHLQPQINPIVVIQQKQSQKSTKDLTSSLSNLDSKIWNNMNSLSYTAKSAPVNTVNMSSNNIPSYSNLTQNSINSNMFNISGSQNLNQSNMMQNNFNQNSWQVKGLTAANLGNQFALTNNSNTLGANWNNNSTQWMSSSNSSQVLNQNNNQNWAQPQNQNTNNKLSNDDIIDLLN